MPQIAACHRIERPLVRDPCFFRIFRTPHAGSCPSIQILDKDDCAARRLLLSLLCVTYRFNRCYLIFREFYANFPPIARSSIGFLESSPLIPTASSGSRPLHSWRKPPFQALK